VTQTIELLRLDECQHTLVGSALARGISGGERKRLCIAQELLVEPSVILLDEPTSGLDSAMSAVTVEVLQSLARARGICVICSIHQPSSQIFHAFDDLFLVAKGEAIYAGPTSAARAFFEKSLQLPCPKDWNTADHLIACCVDGRVDAVHARKQTSAAAADTAVVVEPHQQRVLFFITFYFFVRSFLLLLIFSRL
jgi:ABC-type multidrug transport system ATPase subunit